MKFLFAELVTRPIVNLLIIFLALSAGNLGWSIILLTLVVRIALLSTTASANTMSKHMTDIGPKMQELQEKHKDDPDKLAKETMNLLKTQGSAPLKGCLGLLLQIPVFIALLNVIQGLANNTLSTSYVYSFFADRGVKYLNVNNINHMFMGIDLLSQGNIILTVVCALLLFIQTSMTTRVQPKPTAQKLPNGQAMPDMSKMMPMMNILMVFMMGSFVYSVKSGVGLYIFTSTLFGVLQFIRQYRQVLPIKLKALFHKG
ncbi:MAG TPA: YidC/Oxa1 family membrane protein insertase [Candidatus Absconditabacterales bacterium]|nr:YidC/Oxa1 family membrane protein insertase [Candidatus Absconditabacterales bacterium]HNG96726.1 YidC/Oxa1 family membrane protein insertase [Candidatus Absconditabacterales bacterium]